MRVACVNQDRGIGPGRHKGAAVHLRAIREAFEVAEAEVIPLDEPDDGKLDAALEAACREGPLDLIYERYAIGRDLASAFARDRDIPHVLEVNAPLAEEAARYRNTPEDPRERLRDEATFRNASLILAVSADVARYARGRGAPHDRVEVMPNGVDPNRFRPLPPGDPTRGRTVPPGRLVLGFHGRLRPWHGFDLLVRGMAELLRQDIPAHLLVVGEGEFAEVIDGRLPSEAVTLMGWCPHERIHAWVGCMDVLPLTYAPDQPCYFSPLKLAEAMACGVVPVVPRLGDLPSVVHHRENGLLYTAGNLDELVESLVTLHREPLLRAELSSAAVQAAAAHSWEAMVRRVLARTVGEAAR